MKTVITIVGISIFTNYESERPGVHSDSISDLEFLPFARWDEYREDISAIRRDIIKWANNKSSAEIKSLIEIKNKYKDPQLYAILLTTDTILSYLAAEIIKKYFENNDDISICDKITRINSLQVEDCNEFKKGRDNLIREIQKLAKEGLDPEKDNAKNIFKNIEDNYVLNISGGYKIIIPTMTIISQIYKMRSFYIFENSHDLIESELMPLGFDGFLLEKLYFSIDMLKHQKKDYAKVDRDIRKELESANFVYNNKVTALGGLFHEYVRYNREISGNILGYFVGYKLYEYFHESKKYNDIKHSYCEGRHRELDFVLNNKIIVEVKPMASFLDDRASRKIREQTKGQIEQYQEKYKEHRLYLYTSYKEITSKDVEIKQNIKKLYSQLSVEFSNIKFECFEVYWSLKKQDCNNYQEFMRGKLENKDITSIDTIN